MEKSPATGSSRGIGRVIAAHMASLGASVASRHGSFSPALNEAESLEAVAKPFRRAWNQGVPVHGDSTDEKMVKSLASQIRLIGPHRHPGK
jgi:NAD(P)-dependent dehydrogenase (short-subunit alcohol dehydrogenase family)